MRKAILVFIIVIPVLMLLYFSLTRDPRTLPSALLEKSAPDFDLQTMGGDRVKLGDLRGSPIVINFWSTWCGPCIAEHQLIRRMQQVYAPKGVLFYSILYEDTVENAKQFLKRYGDAAPILLDPGLRTAINYGVAGVPETFFIDRQGKVFYKHAGVLNPRIVAEKLALLMQEESVQ